MACFKCGCLAEPGVHLHCTGCRSRRKHGQVLSTFSAGNWSQTWLFVELSWKQISMFIMDNNMDAYTIVFYDKSAHTLDVLPCTWNFLLSRLTFDFNVATPLQYHVTNNNVRRNTRKSVAFQVQRRQLKLSTVIDSY